MDELKYPMNLEDARNLVKYAAGIVMAVCVCLDNNDFEATHSDALFGAFQLLSSAVKAMDAMNEGGMNAPQTFEDTDT